MTERALCTTDGCNKPTYSRGMCCSHYKRHLKARPPGTAQPRPVAVESVPAMPVERISLPEFLASLAAAVPPLKGARCRAHTQLFDNAANTRKDRDVALAICHDCPALHRCRAWLNGLPAHQRPIGVVAGQVITEDTIISTFQRERAERTERILALHRSGLSLSAIAGATGASKTTVRRALTNRR